MLQLLAHVPTSVLIISILVLLLIPMALLAISRTKRDYMDRN